MAAHDRRLGRVGDPRHRRWQSDQRGGRLPGHSTRWGRHPGHLHSPRRRVPLSLCAARHRHAPGARSIRRPGRSRRFLCHSCGATLATSPDHRGLRTARSHAAGSIAAATTPQSQEAHRSIPKRRKTRRRHRRQPGLCRIRCSRSCNVVPTESVDGEEPATAAHGDRTQCDEASGNEAQNVGVATRDGQTRLGRNAIGEARSSCGHNDTG